MFDVYCPDCAMTTLLGPRRVLSMRNTEPGVITVELLCYDGHRITLVTGRATAGRDTSPQRAPRESDPNSAALPRAGADTPTEADHTDDTDREAAKVPDSLFGAR